MFCTNCGNGFPNGANFCGSCGQAVNPTPSGDDDTGSNFYWEGRYFAHAMNMVFGRTYADDEEMVEDFLQNQTQLASAKNAEAILETSIVLGKFDDTYASTISRADEAIALASSEGIDLGRFFFAKGFALEINEDKVAALTWYQRALEAGFGPSAFFLGQVYFDLGEFSNCIESFIVGRDKYGDRESGLSLEDLEVEDGIYRGEISLPDGSVEIVVYTTKPGGLGTLSTS